MEYKDYKDNSSSCAVKASLAVSIGVFLMVAAGMIFMFTLPFSKGTHFDFNPQPFAAIWAEVIVIPFVMGLYFWYLLLPRYLLFLLL